MRRRDEAICVFRIKGNGLWQSLFPAIETRRELLQPLCRSIKMHLLRVDLGYDTTLIRYSVRR